jgi:hypothetical protein
MACSIIVNYENYSVCESGEVFNNKTNKVLKPLVNYKTGYCTVSLPRPGGGNAQSLYIHHLVGKYFLIKPESDQKLELDHKNNNKQDNSANNLQYVTRSENTRKTLDKTKTTSKYFGVHYDKHNGVWVAQLCSTALTKAYIGTYRSEIEAAIAYNQEALKYGVSKVNQLD